MPHDRPDCATPLGLPSPVSLAALLALSLAVSGCMARGGPQTTGSLAAPGAATSQIDALGKRYEANPADRGAALAYAQALRVNEQNAQAVAVLEAAAIRAPKDPEILAAYGKALVDAGRFQQAEEVLSGAHSPERPDWRILSAQGAAADQQGAHDRAQRYYRTALKIVPDEPSVMSNLGLSYALTKRLADAETTLRKAARHPRADARVRQNLALVLGLQGKFAEAETVVKQDLPPADAAANVAYLKTMVSQPDRWKAMRGLDGKPARTAEVQ